MRAFVLMGAPGSGKSTVGIHAAAYLAWPYLEAEDFHPAKNTEKRAHDIILSEADEEPWIDTLSRAINSQMRPCVIVACSGLTPCVRQRLEHAVQRPISFIHLRASADVLAHRLKDRRHCKDADVPTATLEIPTGAIEIDADAAIDAVIARVIVQMRAIGGAHRSRA